MPIVLNRLSRRTFLRRTAVAVAGLAATPGFTAVARADQSSWALLSDTHIAGAETATAYGINMADHLRRAVQDIISLGKEPAGIFVNGDCAFSSGQKADYGTFGGLVQPLLDRGMTLYAGLGNHDNRENFLEGVISAAPGTRQPVSEKYVLLVRAKFVNWFLLDSLEKTSSTPGLLGKEQLEWLAGALDANHDVPAIVIAHHNPGMSGNMGLKDTVALFEVLRPRRHVKAFIYGHTHTWVSSLDTSGLHLVNLPAVAYAFKADEPSGWVHATVRKNGLRLKLRTVNGHARDGETLDLQWR